MYVYHCNNDTMLELVAEVRCMCTINCNDDTMLELVAEVRCMCTIVMMIQCWNWWQKLGVCVPL